MNIEHYIGRSFAKFDAQGNSHIIFIWRYILAQEHSIVMKFAVIVAQGLLYKIIQLRKMIVYTPMYKTKMNKHHA